MSPLASYRRLFSLAGPLYVLVAFLGRLPLAMSQMGALLLVAGATGSYAAGGLSAGALAVANAVCSPVAGALADRRGQRPVVLLQSLAGGLALGVLVALTVSGSPVGVVVAASAVAGAFLPQIGPLARVRWRPLTDRTGHRQERLLETAFSYEGAADEASFVLGPALLGLLAVIANPAAGLLFAAAMLLVFGVGFALHPSARLLRSSGTSAEVVGRLLTGTFAALLLAQLLIGMVFGSVQTGTTVLATAAGHAGAAGLVHALLGVGSVVAGLAFAALPERIGYPVRVLVSAAGLLVLGTPLLWTTTLGHLVVVVLVLGFAVAPYMISVFTLGERAVPLARVGTAMTLLAAATGLGYAVGSALAGRLADAVGHTGAFSVTVGAAAAALVVAVLAQRPLRRVARRGTASAEPVADAVPPDAGALVRRP